MLVGGLLRGYGLVLSKLFNLTTVHECDRLAEVDPLCAEILDESCELFKLCNYMALYNPVAESVLLDVSDLIKRRIGHIEVVMYVVDCIVVLSSD